MEGPARETPERVVKYPAQLLPAKLKKGTRWREIADALGIKSKDSPVDLSVSAMLRVVAVVERRAREARSGGCREPMYLMRRRGRQLAAKRRKQWARERREKMEEARKRRVAEGPGFYGTPMQDKGAGWPAALEAVRLLPDGPFVIRRHDGHTIKMVAAGFAVIVAHGQGKGPKVINRDSGIRSQVHSVYRITPLGSRARDWARWAYGRYLAGYPAPAHGVAHAFSHVRAAIEGRDVVPCAAGGKKGRAWTAGYGTGDWCDAPWPSAGASWDRG